MRRVVIDAYNFVGLRGGSGGSGSYVLSLIEHLARLIDVRVIASPDNARLFNTLGSRARRLTIHIGDAGHADSIRTATEDADLLYAPFTSLPDRASYAHLPAVTAIHDLQHRALTSFFPEPERVERDDGYFSAAADADGVMTFSQSERDNLYQTFNVPGPIGVVAHAPFLAEEIQRLGHADVPVDQNPYRAKFGRYVLYPAVNWPHKNHYRLVEAFRFLTQVYGVNEVKLVLTGAECVEPRAHFYKTLLDQPWAKDRVLELGFVSNLQLFLLMQGAEILAFPSMYEGFGIPVLESLRLGTPVIASNLPVMREWFSGCFQPFGDIRNSLMMAEDLYQLLTRSERRAALAMTGLERSRNFSSKRMAEETLGFFASIVDDTQLTRQRRTPRRDMAQLLAKKHGLLFHILVDDHTATIGRIKPAIDILRKKLGPATVGFVFYLKAGRIAASPSLPLPASRAEKPRGKGRRHAVADSLQRLVEAGAPLVGADHEFVAQLGHIATDINYVDDTAEGLGRAIHFYVSTQVDARYHCFVHAQQLDALAIDEQLIARCCQQALRQAPDEVDGYYVGSTPWALIRDALVQTVHESPWSLADTTRDDFVLTSHELLLTDRTVSRQRADYFGKGAIIGLALRGTIRQPKARFAYIETELKERVGHHFALASGLCELAKTGGLEPILGANIDAIIDGVSGDILVDAHFSSYSQAPDDHVTPTNFADELFAFLDRHKICASDYVYLHMPYSTLIAGVLQVVATSRVEDLPVFLIRICSVDESFRWHDIRQTSCVRAIAELGRDRHERIRLFVELLPLQRYFEEATGQTLPVLLNPVARELACAQLAAAERVRQRPGAPLVFGYFGEARQEKGFHLLPGIVDRLLHRYGAGRIKFLLQVSSSPQNDTDPIRRARLELEDLAAADKFGASITLLSNFDDMSGYYGAIANCDALLMPYDPAAYRIRGSGVALEGLALGLPIVVTRDTDMASTFEGPGCIVASSFSAADVETACCFVVERYEQIASQLQDYIRTSPLIRSESQFLRRLLGDVPELPAGTPAERPVAIWIGNDVLSQGCSAVYQAQRSSLRRQGFEIYNVYVPYPDGGGFLPTDAVLEKYLVANSLGWRHDGYDFGCYAWWLNQSDDDHDQRRRVLRDIADDGGSTARLLQLNSYNVCPPSLLKLVANRKIDLVCLNYVHLLPVVEKLGLLRRPGTRVVLETHDIQAHQYAVRSGRNVDVEDKELEILRFSDVDAVVAISLAEYDEIRELNPWANVQLAIPTIQSDPIEWTPGASHLTPDWLEIWSQRDDLQATYGLRTPASLMCFLGWILIRGRLEYPDRSLTPGINGVALSRHPAFPDVPDGASVPMIIGYTWDVRPDLRAKWPNATDPGHADRSALLQWALDGGMQEVGLLPDGGLPPQSQKLPTCPSALLEAFVLAHPTRLPETSFQTRLVDWLVKYRGIDVIIVGSDHPANLRSIEQFIEQVFRPYLEPEGVTVLLVGRSGDALRLDESAMSCLLAIGEVASLDPLYAMASVVAVPTVTGSGTPIKVLDAFARGLCVSIPKFVDRALGLSALGFPMTDTPAEFGADILTLLRSPKARQDRIGLARRFADTHLSEASYDAKWAELAGLGPNKQPSEPTEETVLKKAKFPASFSAAWVGSRAQENVDAD